MRGIETAFWGTLGRDPELKTSKGGKAFATMNVAVTIGQTEDGKPLDQWLRVVFDETAERIAGSCHKQDRVYCEGALTLESWTAKDGAERTGLKVVAFKCEKVAAIGKNRPRRDTGGEFAKHAAPVKSDGNGRGHAHEFEDELSF
jgi:single-stranded DNA-binding protein